MGQAEMDGLSLCREKSGCVGRRLIARIGLSYFGSHGDKLFRRRRMNADRRIELCLGRPANASIIASSDVAQRSLPQETRILELWLSIKRRIAEQKEVKK